MIQENNIIELVQSVIRIILIISILLFIMWYISYVPEEDFDIHSPNSPYWIEYPLTHI